LIHIATLHYRDESWIDPQLRYLERHTSEDYRVYTCLDGVDRRQFARFHHAEERWDPIQFEFDHLAAVISEQADPDDMLVFMHGDTFPIADWVGPVRKMLAERPLAGIRRDENLGEPHPHACFTATTPRLWNEIGADWARGPVWTGTNGAEVTDLGATLWRELSDRGIEWEPILRTNTVDPHPLWFGVYGDIVYHHGAAFRKPMSRLDASLAAPKRHVYILQRFVQLELAARRSARLSRELYEQLIRDEDFWRELASGEGSAT
jgi:hypothetical protein